MLDDGDERQFVGLGLCGESARAVLVQELVCVGHEAADVELSVVVFRDRPHFLDE